MFILVTPISLSGAERPRPGVTGHSHNRSDSSSRSSRPKVASLSIRRCRWHVCSIFSLLMSLRSRMSCLASCWSCKRISVCKREDKGVGMEDEFVHFIRSRMDASKCHFLKDWKLKLIYSKLNYSFHLWRTQSHQHTVYSPPVELDQRCFCEVLFCQKKTHGGIPWCSSLFVSKHLHKDDNHLYCL